MDKFFRIRNYDLNNIYIDECIGRTFGNDIRANKDINIVKQNAIKLLSKEINTSFSFPEIDSNIKKILNLRNLYRKSKNIKDKNNIKSELGDLMKKYGKYLILFGYSKDEEIFKISYLDENIKKDNSGKLVKLDIGTPIYCLHYLSTEKDENLFNSYICGINIIQNSNKELVPEYVITSKNKEMILMVENEKILRPEILLDGNKKVVYFINKKDAEYMLKEFSNPEKFIKQEKQINQNAMISISNMINRRF